MRRVDLNSDLGEGFGNYKLGMDSEILKHITSANIACGYHAGDPLVMDKTIKLAKENNVSIGAHPGFPDMMGFGRRNMKVSTDELESYIIYQLGALMGFACKYGVRINHVKPHGAMYNMASKNYDIAIVIARAIKEVDASCILMGLSESELIRAGKDIGLKTASEVFADRAYNDDGSLVSRNIKGAVIHDEEVAIKRTVKMVNTGCVTSITGKEIELSVDSICVHGDNPNAILFVKKIRKSLEEQKVSVCRIGD